MLLKNQRRFVTDDYSEDGPIVKEAVVTYYETERIAYTQQLEISKTELESDDNLFFAFGSLTAKEDYAF